MIPVIVKLCESPSRAGGLLMINYFVAVYLIIVGILGLMHHVTIT
jgi:hypothetical protein